MEKKINFMNNLNYILIGFSFIAISFLFYRINKNENVTCKKRIYILKLCSIILLLLGFVLIITGLIPEKINWEKENENWYYYNDGIKQINIVTNEDMLFNFEDFISYQSNILLSKGYLVEVNKISKIQKLNVNKYINSYYKYTNFSNTFILFTVTKNKNYTKQNIYVGKIINGKKDIHTVCISASLKNKYQN